MGDNITAVITKRMHIYKRDKTGLICEIIIPIILVIFGLLLTKINILSDSPGVPIEPTAYPAKQRILLNDALLAPEPGSVTPKMLYDNLPDVDSMFELTQTGVTDWAGYSQ